MIIPQIFQFVGQIIRLLCSLQNVLQMTPLAFQTHLQARLVWLNLFNAELVPKRYWRGSRSEDVGEEGDYMYLTLHCHRQNDSCIKMGSDESRFNVSLIVRDKVTRQCPHATTSKKRREPKRNRTEVPLLTGLTPCAGPHQLTWMNVPLNVQLARESWFLTVHAESAAKAIIIRARR